MTGEGTPTITDVDVRSLAARLKGLHALLTPGEQALLRAALRRAAARDEAEAADTEGFLWGVSFNPFVYLDAIEADLRGSEETRGAWLVRISSTGTGMSPRKGEGDGRDDGQADGTDRRGGRADRDEADGLL
jgi:hypothetical protein